MSPLGTGDRSGGRSGLRTRLCSIGARWPNVVPDSASHPGAIEIGACGFRCLRDYSLELAGYTKACSMIWAHLARMPSASGVIVLKPQLRKSRQFAERFLLSRGLRTFMLRSDTRNQRWANKRGGNVFSVAILDWVLRSFHSAAVIPIVLEPLSRLDDEYSIAGIFNPVERSLSVEIVGSGFDASDLMRGEIPAHEELALALDPSGNIRYERTSVIDSQAYEQSVRTRVEKLRKQLPRRSLESRRIERVPIRLPSAYVPIPSRYIGMFVSHVERLWRVLLRRGVVLSEINISASVIRRELVFWDFASSRKEENRQLWLSGIAG